MRPTPVPRPAAILLLLAMLFAGCAEPTRDAASAALDPVEVAPTGIVREFDLFLKGDHEMQIAGTWPFSYRLVTDEAEIGTIPGPEIRVKQGDTVRLRLHDGAHTIHWHGVRLPWGMDGVPDVTQALGEGVFTYEFVAQDAGTFWYHCHVDAPEHIDLGMFGAFIVEPADARDDPPFDREATLFLHEMDLASYAWTDFAEGAAAGGEPRPGTATRGPDHAADLPEHARNNAAGFTTVWASQAPGGGAVPYAARAYMPRYDTFLINGKTYPETDPVAIAEGETMRIRLINAGQLVHTMHLHGHRFLVTHKDGARLESPWLADTIGLFPGERYDIYVKADNPGHWDFHDHGGGWGVGGYATNRGHFPGGMGTMLVYEDWRAPAQLPAPQADAHARHHAHAESPRGSMATRASAPGTDAPVVKLPAILGVLP